jgi:hypothetical protein
VKTITQISSKAEKYKYGSSKAQQGTKGLQEVHLREGLSIGLDVIGTPQHDGDGLWPLPAILLPLHLQQPAAPHTCIQHYHTETLGVELLDRAWGHMRHQTSR